MRHPPPGFDHPGATSPGRTDREASGSLEWAAFASNLALDVIETVVLLLPDARGRGIVRGGCAVIAVSPTLACSLDLALTGAAVLSIPDACGELVAYRLEDAAPGLSAWAVSVTRLDSGERYRVSLEWDGSWRCDCKDALYRGRPRKRPCKHGRAAQALHDFLTAFGVAP